MSTAIWVLTAILFVHAVLHKGSDRQESQAAKHPWLQCREKGGWNHRNSLDWQRCNWTIADIELFYSTTREVP